MKSLFLSRVVLILVILTSPVQSFGGVDAFFRTSPYAAAAMVCGMKGVCADVVAQMHQFQQQRAKTGQDTQATNGSLVVAIKQDVKKIDLKRTAAFLIYGALYQGLVLEHSYNRLYPRLFGAGHDLLSILQKVSFNMILQSPFMTLPVAYITKAFVFGYSVPEAVRKYLNDVFHHKLLLKFYMLWVPVMSFTFGVVPDHLRVSFCAMVSFFWMICLSAISNKNPSQNSDDSCLLVDGATCQLNE